MACKWSIELIKEKCKELGIECLEEEYKNYDSKMLFKCSCGRNTFTRTWYHVFKRGQIKCDQCLDRTKWDIEKIKVKCEELNITCLEESYKNRKFKMRFICSCGNVFVRSWTNILLGYTYCDSCGSKTLWNIDKVKIKCEELGMRCLSTEYINLPSELRVIGVCGHEFETSFAMILSGKTRCNSCNCGKKWDNTMVDIECKKMGIVRLSNYISYHEKIKLKGICGHEFETTWNKVLNRNQIECQECVRKRKESKACINITNILEEDKIIYIKEYKIEECKNTLPLPFDFAIFKNDELQFLIEYDGEQHFKPASKFNEKKGFEYRQKNDAIKDKYCRDNNIKLYRIRYDENEEDKLKEILKKEKLI